VGLVGGGWEGRSILVAWQSPGSCLKKKKNESGHWVAHVLLSS
jgi:hypothetical protein